MSLPPATARAFWMALAIPSVTKVRFDGPLGTASDGGGLWVRTNTGTPFTGCAPFQPFVIS